MKSLAFLVSLVLSLGGLSVAAPAPPIEAFGQMPDGLILPDAQPNCVTLVDGLVTVEADPCGLRLTKTDAQESFVWAKIYPLQPDETEADYRLTVTENGFVAGISSPQMADSVVAGFSFEGELLWQYAVAGRVLELAAHDDEINILYQDESLGLVVLDADGLVVTGRAFSQMNVQRFEWLDGGAVAVVAMENQEKHDAIVFFDENLEMLWTRPFVQVEGLCVLGDGIFVLEYYPQSNVSPQYRLHRLDFEGITDFTNTQPGMAILYFGAAGGQLAFQTPTHVLMRDAEGTPCGKFEFNAGEISQISPIPDGWLICSQTEDQLVYSGYTVAWQPRWRILRFALPAPDNQELETSPA